MQHPSSLRSREHSPAPSSDSNSPGFCFRSIGLPCLIHSDGLLAQPFHHISQFDIRLDNDVIIFQGSDQESTSQLLKGVLILNLPSSLKIQDIHLQFNGTLRFSWKDLGLEDLGLTSHRVKLLEHRWPPFVGQPDKSTTLPAGNYEWPFEVLLPGETAESVEGIPEASIRYTLKATISRGKLSRDLHAYKPVRIIRTLSIESLQMQFGRSVENTWLNKVDYQISIPETVVPFCGSFTLKMLFIPLLKGLEIGEINVTLAETRECYIQTSDNAKLKEHRTERNVSEWHLQVTRESDWQTRIEDTEQDGWYMVRKLNLPDKLSQCIQDLNHNGIKVSHKVKVQLQLRNPDSHMSQLVVGLPITIFISPHILPERHGTPVNHTPTITSTAEEGTIPPGYGAHILDQLYEDINRCQAGQTRSQEGSVQGLISPEDSDSGESYDLTRLPTYNTAVRSSLISHAPSDSVVLPSYDTVENRIEHLEH